MKLSDYYDAVRTDALEKCVGCGHCIRKCPITPVTALRDKRPRNVQRQVLDFLDGGAATEDVFERAFACTECYRCIESVCPVDLNPMMVNQVIKWEYRQRGCLDTQHTFPVAADSPQRLLASAQCSGEDYRRITTASTCEHASVVFFPGCNVYKQPDKLLSALDVLAAITDDYAFVPGLDDCCSVAYIFGATGAIEQADAALESLLAKVQAYQPETVVFWCPTCLCHFEKTVAQVAELPYRMVSFAQFVAEHMDALPLETIPQTVTLHEPCKTGFTGIDVDGPRAVLAGLPGTELIEMPRHGANAACCAAGIEVLYGEHVVSLRAARLQEAADTGAEKLVNVCHGCHRAYLDGEAQHGFEVVNYISLIARALGIERPDKYKAYWSAGDIEQIIADAEPHIAQSPFPREQVVAALRAQFDSGEHRA